MSENFHFILFIFFPPRISLILVACYLRHDCEESVSVSFFFLIFLLVKSMDGHGPFPPHPGQSGGLYQI